jgi:eukaryotic translation initiation factor 2C
MKFSKVTFFHACALHFLTVFVATHTGTHTASYAYARATKAVSLIPPAYYADLACERGRCYLNDFLVAEDQTTTSSNRGKRDREEEEKRVFETATRAWGRGIHEALKASMFYL